MLNNQDIASRILAGVDRTLPDLKYPTDKRPSSITHFKQVAQEQMEKEKADAKKEKKAEAEVKPTQKHRPPMG